MFYVIKKDALNRTLYLRSRLGIVNWTSRRNATEYKEEARAKIAARNSKGEVIEAKTLKGD
jgi:hypothetical protein